MIVFGNFKPKIDLFIYITKGLPYMLERAGLDVQQGKMLFFRIELWMNVPTVIFFLNLIM